MTKRLDTPNFRSEEEEANWWDSNQGMIGETFEQAAKDGTLGHGTVAQRAGIPTTTIRLDPADIELARAQAAQHGLRYQTYLKMLIHKALHDPANAQATSR